MLLLFALTVILSGSDTAFVIAIPDLVAENIAFDSTTNTFLVGSIAQRRIFRVDRHGATRAFAGPGADFGSILGLKVDPGTQTLWVNTFFARDSISHHRQRHGSALLEVDLRSGAVRRRYVALDSSSDHLFNDIAVATNGDVFITDSEGNAVYVKRAGAAHLSPLVSAGSRALDYPNGIAMAPDAEHVIVADWNGLLAVNRQTGVARRFTTTAGDSLGGIDGLYQWRNTLIGIQPLHKPPRVVAARLDTRVHELQLGCVRVLEQGNPAYDQPTTGVVYADTLFYVANSQVRRVDDLGRLSTAGAGTHTVVLAQPLTQLRC
jgi:DNA-binding beta-propeller fold protein YncE